MIVLDGYKSHLSAQFEKFYKEQNIITLYLPAHSSYITQPLDIGCFSVLKRMYGRELEAFIKAHINHITKTEFFIAFKAAHLATMKAENIRAGFRGAGLVPDNPQAVLSKLDVKLRTPTPTGPPLLEADPWVSQTPHKPSEAILQSEHVRTRIANHQGSSPTSMFSAVKQLAKGIELIVHEMTLLQDRVRTLEKANEALSKRRRAKRTRLQAGGALTIEEGQALIAEKETGRRQSGRRLAEGGTSETRLSTLQRCGRCGKTRHNVRTCQEDEATSAKESSIECN